MVHGEDWGIWWAKPEAMEKARTVWSGSDSVWASCGNWRHWWPNPKHCSLSFLPPASGWHLLRRHKEVLTALLFWVVWEDWGTQHEDLSSLPFFRSCCLRTPSLGSPSSRGVDSWRNDPGRISAQEKADSRGWVREEENEIREEGVFSADCEGDHLGRDTAKGSQ